MNHRFSLPLILLALVLSACGTSAPNGTNATNPSGVEATTTTGSAPVATTGANDGAATTMTEPTSAAPTSSTTDATTATGTQAPMATTVAGNTAAPTGTGDEEMGDIQHVLANDARFSTLARAIDLAKLNNVLREAGPYTLFAPTNDAFATLPAGQLDKLLADPTQLGQLLSYHVVAGNFKAADIGTMTTLQTLNGKPIQITKSGNDVMLNGTTRLVTTDIITTNGVIHVIDKILTPTS